MKDLTQDSIKLDLHVHSNFSDGSMSVDELFKLACQKGISHLAITDHDTLEGFSEIIETGDKYQICAIPGLELSAFSYKIQKKVHILAYGLPMKASCVFKLCKTTLERRTRNTLRQIEILQRKGYMLSIEEVQKAAGISTALYKQHIMQVLVNKGYTQHILSPLYIELFKGNGIASGEIEYIDVMEAVKAIKTDGGMAVLAHPAMSNCQELIAELVEIGLDGLEVDHPKHSQEEKEELKEMAGRFQLIPTGGSDFHGIYGDECVIGQSQDFDYHPFLEILMLS